MIRHIVTFSIRRSGLVLWSMGILILLAVQAIRTIPTDVLPDIQSPIFQVFVEAPGLSAEEVDLLITLPVESALRGLPRVVRTRSMAMQDLGTVRVQFEWGVDFYQAYQWILNEITRLRPELPPQVTVVSVSNALTRIAEVYEMYLYSDARPLIDLREFADYDLGYVLRRVPGVFKITTQGGYVRQYEVRVHPHRLTAYGLTIGDVARTLQRNNTNLFGNVWIRKSQEIPVLGWGRLRDLRDLAHIVLTEIDGTPVRLQDVATVTEGHALRRGAFLIGQREGVHMLITKQFGISTAPFLERLQSTIEDFLAFMPPDVHLGVHYNQLDLIQDAIRSLTEALLIGLAVVFVVLLILMGDIASTVVIAIMMPTSVLVTFIFLRLFGYTINIMTLGAMVVALGIMIDAAIMDTENIYRHLCMHPNDRTRAIVEGSVEVRRPVIYSTLIIMLIFIPLLFLPEFAGRLFAPFAFTVIVAVAVGFVLSITLTPALCDLLLRPRMHASVGETPVIRVLRRGYQYLLTRLLRPPYSYTTVLLGVLFLGGIFWMVPRLHTRLFPSLDEGAFWIALDAPPDISLQQNVELARAIARALKTVPDVREVYTKIGRTEGAEHAERVNRIEIFVALVERERRTHPFDTLRALLREKLRPFQIPFEVTTPLIGERVQEAISGVTADFMIGIYGEDPGTLDTLAAQLERRLAQMPGLVDIRRAQILPVTQLVIRPDRTRAARYGVDFDDLRATIEIGLGGRVVTSVIRDIKQYGVLVRFSDDVIRSLDRIRNLPVHNDHGGWVPLHAVATVAFTPTPARILRENLQRMTYVTANVTGVGYDAAMQTIRSAIASMSWPAGYTVGFGGQYASKQRLTEQLTFAGAVVLLAILMLLYFAFDSIWVALIAIFTIPLGLSGGVLALLLTGESLNISSMIGFLAHFGLSVQKALILIEFALDRMRAGTACAIACLDAGTTRMRPVLMTALAAGMAVVPIVLGYGAGVELQRPLAIVLIGGLVTSTLLTLICLPILLYWSLRNRS